jgi:RHH-type proline utilization regulon transcriptional repressor/proline dehydrogenase/delta 1-pyrroline-5-carboxylate dehydrogenase
LGESGSEAQLVRVVAAATAAGARVHVSSAISLTPAVAGAIGAVATAVEVENDAAWSARVQEYGAGRIRLIGDSASTVTSVTDGRPDLALYDNPVTESGRIEILPFVKEQSVSISAHRFGTPNHLTDTLI